MKIVFRLMSLKTYSVDAIAQRMIELDSSIVPYAHCVYICNTEHEDYVRNKSNIKYKEVFRAKDMFDRYKNDKLDIDFLKDAERKYAIPNFWNIIYHARDLNPFIHWQPGHHIYSEAELLRWLQAGIKHIEDLIIKCKPDIYLDIFNVTFLRALTRCICRYYGVKWLIPLHIRYKDTACIVDNPLENVPQIQEQYKLLVQNKDADLSRGYSEVKDFRKKKRTAYNLNDLTLVITETVPFAKEINRLLTIKSYFKMIIKEIDYLFNKNEWKNNYRSRHPISMYFNKLEYQYNKFKVRVNGLPENSYSEETPYFLFTLCTVPEEAIEVRAPFFDDEVFMIKTIVKSLPLDCHLYVKEHKTMIYKRPFRFYKEIAKIPKVKVLSPYLNIVDLIINSVGVITIGLETIMYGKPLIVFGDAFYNFLDFVVKVKDLTELPFILKKARAYQPDTRKIAAFFQSIVDNTFRISITLFDSLDPNVEQYLEGEYSESIEVLSSEFIKYIKAEDRIGNKPGVD